MNVESLRDFWHVSAVRSFLKAKGRSLRGQVSQSDYAVYQRCEDDAKSVVDVSQCIVALLDARSARITERITKHITLKEESWIPGFEYLNDEVKRIITKLRQWISTNVTPRKIKSTVTYRRLIPPPEMIEKIKQKALSFAKYHSDADSYKLRYQRPIKSSLLIARKRSEYAMRGVIKGFMGQNSRNRLPLKRLRTSTIKRGRERRDQSQQQQPWYAQQQLLPDSKWARLAAAYFTALIGGEASKLNVSLENLKKLQIIREHYAKVDLINRYVERLNSANLRFLHEWNFPIDSYVGRMESAEENVLLRDTVTMINKFQNAVKGQSMSIMSPRFFSILPETSVKKRFLSPTIFSFQRDGFFSIPDLFKMIDSKDANMYLIELLLELSGASKALDQLMNSTESERRETANLRYPLVKMLIGNEKNWQTAINSYSAKQMDELNTRGYAFLNSDQLKLIYGPSAEDKLQMKLNTYESMSETEKEEMIESKIRGIAALKGHQMQLLRRFRRHATRADGHELFHTFEPYAFSSHIEHGTALEVLTLSPYVFDFEFLFPEALGVRTLSPSAFAASILSPTALIATILSPTTFRAEILSPRALTPLILSPEALVADILSPHFLEPRVLSPEALIIDVLNPEFLSPRIGSGESVGVLVLSPRVLSPKIVSGEKMIVEILSPHVLGGSHEEEKSEEDEKDDEKKEKYEKMDKKKTESEEMERNIVEGDEEEQ